MRSDGLARPEERCPPPRHSPALRPPPWSAWVMPWPSPVVAWRRCIDTAARSSGTASSRLACARPRDGATRRGFRRTTPPSDTEPATPVGRTRMEAPNGTTRKRTEAARPSAGPPDPGA